MSSAEAKGLVSSLFDFSFTSLITTKIIRFVYALTVALYTLGAVGLLIAGLASGSAAGVFAGLILVPVGYLVYLIFIRMWMEFLIVVFRMGDDIHALRSGGPMGGGAPYELP